MYWSNLASLDSCLTVYAHLPYPYSPNPCSYCDSTRTWLAGSRSFPFPFLFVPYCVPTVRMVFFSNAKNILAALLTFGRSSDLSNSNLVLASVLRFGFAKLPDMIDGKEPTDHL